MKNTLELRYSTLEYRSGDGREGPGVLTGTVIRYGDTADLPWGKERFAPGALTFDDVILDLQHQRTVPLARTEGGGLEVSEVNGSVIFRATLPDTGAGRDAATLTRQKVLRGASAAFVAMRARMESGVRVITQARLQRIGLVDDPMYPDSHITAMRARFDVGSYRAERGDIRPFWV